MADKSITQLNQATMVGDSDLFVLNQGGTAKRLSGIDLTTYLLNKMQAKGGITNITLESTSALVDRYKITYSTDGIAPTYFEVKNGKGITGISKTATSGLRDTYTINYNDGTISTFDVINGKGISNFSETKDGLNHNYKLEYTDGTKSEFTIKDGEKGNKGDNSYVHIRYSSVMPDASHPAIGTDPEDYIGIYNGISATAPTSYTEYTWYRYKGEKGETGDDLTVRETEVRYLKSASGTTIPEGSWSPNVPNIRGTDEDRYLWTRIIYTFADGSRSNPAYSVSYHGADGTGSVNSVNGKGGNVMLYAEDINTSRNQTVEMELTEQGNITEKLADDIREVEEKTENYIALAYRDTKTLEIQQKTWTDVHFTFPKALDTEVKTVIITPINGWQVNTFYQLSSITRTGFTLKLYRLDATATAIIGAAIIVIC